MQESLPLRLEAPATSVSISRWEKLGWACKHISSRNHSSSHSTNGQASHAFVDGWVETHVLLDMNHRLLVVVVVFSVICPHLVPPV